ncbi:MAG TPA: EAL domain-containing protein [Acidobacteriaceae bacterium]
MSTLRRSAINSLASSIKCERLLGMDAKLFRIVSHKPATRLAVVLCGSIFGAVIAYVAAHAIQLHAAHAELQSYANRLVRIGEKLGDEDTEAISAVLHANLSFCSDEELAFMRNYVFRSEHIRDIGRMKNGKLYCTTGIGRLTRPKPSLNPDISTHNVRIHVDTPLMISPQSKGFVVETDSVSLVLNPESIQNFNEPPLYYSAFLFDRQTGQIVQTYGPTVSLTKEELLAGKRLERNGIFYQPTCSSRSMVCQVAIESRSDVLAKGRLVLTASMVVGGLLGASFALSAVLFSMRQRSMEQQLRRAIRQQALTFVYQPIVDLQTRRILGAEALARWINEENEFVRPDIFVALAESRGFASEITRLAIHSVLGEMGDLLRSKDIRVTINITAQDLTDPEFPAVLKRSLERHNIQSSAIGLELTERSTATHRTAIQALSQLKDAGHVLYIDDFGTGYSSLSYIHRLAVDGIKIDRSFTQTIGTEAVTASVVPQILDMAAQLELLVVVEGIETEEQAMYFRTAGRSILGQGWLFGKPMPAAQFHALFRQEIH